MKKILCSDLGGPANCDVAIMGETFDELGENSKTHVMQMVAAGDEDHQAAIEKMKSATPEEQQKMFASFKEAFDNASEE